MKKAMTCGMAAVLVAGSALAQQDVVMVGPMKSAPAKGYETWATVEGNFHSSHVWRGQVRNNDFIFQPQATIGVGDFSFNVVSTYDLGRSWTGVSSDPSEIDLSVAYQLPFAPNDWELTVGVIDYNYPANGRLIAPVQPKSTTELFARAALVTFVEDFHLVPVVTLFGDIGEVEGTYAKFELYAPFQFGDYMTVQGGIAAGWGNTAYNDYYWATGTDAKWNDYSCYVGASYEVIENMVVSGAVSFSAIEGGAIADADVYESKEKCFATLGVAYKF